MISRYKVYIQDLSYKNYVCDAVQAIAARQGVDISDRWYDTITTSKDTRTEAEIALEKFFSEVR